MNHHCESIISKTQQCFDMASKLYGFPKTLVKAKGAYSSRCDHICVVEFPRKGTAAGWARYISIDVSSLRFILAYMETDPRETLNNTVPHEVAHIVHRWLVMQGRTRDNRSHGHAWRRVCISLGGDGERCHSMKVHRARKTESFKYQNGAEVFWVGKNIHNKIQRGNTRVSKRTGARIDHTHFTGET